MDRVRAQNIANFLLYFNDVEFKNITALIEESGNSAKFAGHTSPWFNSNTPRDSACSHLRSSMQLSVPSGWGHIGS
jgi:hypothetical protein